MKKTTILNRYDDKITFEKTKNGNVKVYFNTEWVRGGIDPKTNKTTFIDPPGGPLLSLGKFSLKCYDHNSSFEDFEIIEIKGKKYGALLKIKK